MTHENQRPVTITHHQNLNIFTWQSNQIAEITYKIYLLLYLIGSVIEIFLWNGLCPCTSNHL